MPKTRTSLAAAMLLAVPLAGLAGKTGADGGLVERGRYVVEIGGCNDCHTPGYAMSDGKVPEREWLTGDRLGWQGPWGTTYPPNLRQFFARTSEAEWLKMARHANYRPPMPSPSLRAMSDEDLRALWHYVRSLGPGGETAPAYVGPERAPAGPVVRFPATPG